MELLANKELLDEVKNLVNNGESDNELTDTQNIGIQSGGYVFDLIPSMTGVFTVAAEFIGNFLVKSFKLFFKINLLKVGRRKDGTEYAYPSPHLKGNEGQFWRYLRLCFKASLFLCIFALGGVLITVFGLLYLYTRLFKQFGKLNKNGNTSDTPPKKPEV